VIWLLLISKKSIWDVIVEANYLPWKGLIIEEGKSDWDWLVYDFEDGSVWYVDDDELKPLSEE
jgi:hypothetical protein